MPRTAKDWRNFGDRNFPEYGGRLVRYGGDGHVHVIELYTEMDGDADQCNVSAYDIDMRDFDQDLVKSVLSMCGLSREDFRDEEPNGLERTVRLAADAVSHSGNRWRVFDSTCSSKEIRQTIRDARRALAQWRVEGTTHEKEG